MSLMGKWSKAAALAVLVSASARAAEPPPLQIRAIGDLTLESGAVLRDAKLGYRTEGTLNADRTNAILFPTWFTGTTAGLYAAGAVATIDTSKFFLITVDAFGNGVSSSPSNNDSFTEVTIRDMVRAEYVLVTEVLDLDHLHAVTGISMGGMQTFEWMTAYPDFMEKAVPIVGSSRLASYDVLLWETELEAIALARASGDEARASALVGMISSLALWSPDYHARKTLRARSEEFLRAAKAGGSQIMSDRASQLRAMLAHDVSKPYGGSLEKAAGAVRAEVLNVVSRKDHMVTPAPAIRFAELLGAESLLLENDCGHLATSCDGGRSTEAIRKFLE
jgi:homoserine O-acetyltransferase